MGGLYLSFVFDKELVKKILQRHTIFIIKPIVRYTPIQDILNLSHTEYAWELQHSHLFIGNYLKRLSQMLEIKKKEIRFSQHLHQLMSTEKSCSAAT